MKYGQLLGKRSVPEWRAHNILYEDIKLEIKELTTGASSFSEEGYAHLVRTFLEEMQSAKLFVDCKVGEIEYRFQQCDVLVRDLASEHEDTKYWQLHWQVQKLAQEIQKLSRFITAQYTGVRKLIKKYRRHAPPEQRKQHNLQDVESMLAKKGSFATVDLTPQFLELSVLYKALRAQQFSNFHSPTAAAVESDIDRYVQFDLIMQTTPVDTILQFWIHPEYLVQAKVLLLQHMDLVGSSDDGECTDTTYLDTEDLEFARGRNGPAKLQKVSDGANVRYILAVPPSGLRHTAATFLTEEEVEHTKNGDFGFAESLDMSAQLALGWVSTHSARPVSETVSHRTRFLSSTEATWATIDSNVRIPGTNNTLPHAVLELHSKHGAEWIEEVKKSHLLYPVPSSFSLYAWTLLRTQASKISALPRWLADLDSGKDIRREAEPVAKDRVLPKRSASSLQLHTDVPEAPRARYWNEFDDGDEFDTGDVTQFIDEEDQALRRARVAAKIATPVYVLGESMRKQWRSLFERRSSESSLGSALDTPSLDSNSSAECTPLTNETGQFSPRVRPRSLPSYGSIPNIHADAENHFQQQRNDQGLALITFLCFCLSIGIVALVYTILLTEDVGLLPFGLKLALSLFLIIALILAGAGDVAFNFCSTQDWISQALVQATLFSVVCFGVGGIATIAGPQL